MALGFGLEAFDLEVETLSSEVVALDLEVEAFDLTESLDPTEPVPLDGVESGDLRKGGLL